MNLVISHAPSADNSNLSADGDDSFISVEMDSAMPSPFSEVRESNGKGVGSEGAFLSVIYVTGDCYWLVWHLSTNSLSYSALCAFKFSFPSSFSHPLSPLNIYY